MKRFLILLAFCLTLTACPATTTAPPTDSWLREPDRPADGRDSGSSTSVLHDSPAGLGQRNDDADDGAKISLQRIRSEPQRSGVSLSGLPRTADSSQPSRGADGSEQTSRRSKRRFPCLR